MSTENENIDFKVDWIYAQYGKDESVTSIAAEIGKSEAYVYAKMRKKPEKSEDVKCIREEKRDIRVRRISSIADRNIETYIEDMQDDQERARDDIDKIDRISKEFAHRLQLSEGKATANIGVIGDSVGWCELKRKRAPQLFFRKGNFEKKPRLTVLHNYL